MRTVVVYERAGCHLCEEALVIVERVRARTPFELRRVDIDSDDALFKRYLERIPVVTVDGEERFEFFVNELSFEQAVTK